MTFSYRSWGRHARMSIRIARNGELDPWPLTPPTSMLRMYCPMRGERDRIDMHTGRGLRPGELTRNAHEQQLEKRLYQELAQLTAMSRRQLTNRVDQARLERRITLLQMWLGSHQHSVA